MREDYRVCYILSVILTIFVIVSSIPLLIEFKTVANRIANPPNENSLTVDKQSINKINFNPRKDLKTNLNKITYLKSDITFEVSYHNNNFLEINHLKNEKFESINVLLNNSIYKVVRNLDNWKIEYNKSNIKIINLRGPSKIDGIMVKWEGLDEI